MTLVTDFGFNGRHAYYYYALEKGYYKDAGIDLTIVRGQGSADAVKQVAAGTAQLGFADTSAVIFGRANDGIPVKLVAVIYARPPHAIYVLKELGITKPKDLEGRSVADTAFSAVPKMFAAYAKAAGIDASKVKWIVAGSDPFLGMLSLGRVDGIGQYTVGEPLLKKAAAPKEITKLAYADAGLNFYGAGLIATENTIKTQPDMIRRFVGRDHAGTEGRLRQAGRSRADHEQVSQEHRCRRRHRRNRNGVRARACAQHAARVRESRRRAAHDRHRRRGLRSQEACHGRRRLRTRLCRKLAIAYLLNCMRLDPAILLGAGSPGAQDKSELRGERADRVKPDGRIQARRCPSRNLGISSRPTTCHGSPFRVRRPVSTRKF